MKNIKKGVFIILYRDNKILFLQRRDNKYYSFPAGKVQKNEDVKIAAIRELYEEVGLVIKENDLILKHKMLFISKESINHIGYFYEVLKYTGIEFLKEPEKHIKFAWIDKNKLVEKNISKHCMQALNMIEKGILGSEFIMK